MKRVKRRYLALQLELEGVPGEKELLDALWGSVARLYGEVGASLTSLALISFDASRNVAVVRTSLETFDMVRASFACVTSVGGREAAVHVLAVSGTIKALFEKLK
ncbi:MAG: Rpp14/Pop5 family protein [Candidatus Bathyarchaeia archaeon]